MVMGRICVISQWIEFLIVRILDLSSHPWPCNLTVTMSWPRQEQDPGYNVVR